MKISQFKPILKRFLPSSSRVIDEARTLRELTLIVDAILDQTTSRVDVVLTHVGADYINLIKLVRALTKLGLKESKDIVDAVKEGKSSIILKGVNKAHAENAVHKLALLGSTAVMQVV